MTLVQQIITICIVVIGTQLTRWLPFLILDSKKQSSAYIRYMGRVLPPAIFGMLVVYCFRNLDLLSGTHGIPELVCGCCVAILQLLFKNMGLSIAAGTIMYVMWVN